MKIDPVRGTTLAGGARRAAGADASGFSLPADSARAAAAPASVAAPGALNAVLALQVDDRGRRQRQTRRAALSLDAMDRLQAAMLAGADDGPELAALRSHLAGREPTGEAGLDAVLREIDVRAAVELAKRARSGAGRA